MAKEISLTVKQDSSWYATVLVHDEDGNEIGSAVFDTTKVGFRVEVWRDEVTQIATVPVKT